jgi:hypothetical protein
MQARELTPLDASTDRAALERQVRSLQERLAFYEGFDQLIQDNVAQARELFRLAAQEREAAATAAERAQRDADDRAARFRGELESIAADVSAVTQAVEALSRRVARALGESPQAHANGWGTVLAARSESPLAVVVHGVPSARTALSLQRFVASLPQVTGVSAREFVGGVLRLDARVQDRLQVEQFRAWDDASQIQALTERPDVIEFALEDFTEPDRLGA